MSNANPLLAKLALDNEAKHTPTMRANWSYQDVEEKVWSIPKMTDFWGIGRRMEKRLHALGIFSIKELATSNPDQLKKLWVRLVFVCGFMLTELMRAMFISPIKPNPRAWGILKSCRETT